jgi:protein PsiE
MISKNKIKHGVGEGIMHIALIIAMTALTRMIILQTKGTEPLNILYESGGILILAIAAFIMSAKDRISLEKATLRNSDEEA